MTMAKRFLAAACFLFAIGGPAMAQHSVDFPGGRNQTARLSADDHFRQAMRHKANRDWDKALNSLLETVKIDRTYKQAFMEAAWIGIEQRNYKFAETMARAAVKIDVDYADGWRELGVALLKQGDLDGADSAIAKALKLNMRDRATWTYAAEVLKAMGKHADAELARDVADSLK